MYNLQLRPLRHFKQVIGGDNKKPSLKRNAQVIVYIPRTWSFSLFVIYLRDISLKSNQRQLGGPFGGQFP